LFFDEQKHIFDEFSSQIVHVVVNDLPDSEDSWLLEHFQRNAITRGLASASPQDLVIVSDVDEIPTPHAIRILKECEGWDQSGPIHFFTRFYNFKFTWQFEAMWFHPQASTYDWITRNSPQTLRMSRTRPSFLRLDDAGWHMSFFADPERIMEKIRAYAHQEFNRQDMLDKEAITQAIANGTDYFYAHGKGEVRFGLLFHNPTCHGLPEFVVRRAEYANWLPEECQQQSTEL